MKSKLILSWLLVDRWKIRKLKRKMELTELSTQLKTCDIVDNKKSYSSVPLDKINPFSNDNRRFTRSQLIPKCDLETPVQEYSTLKNSRKVLDPEDKIRKIYLNDKVKVVHRNLETIFENPVIRKGNTMFLGIGKHKRSIYFCREFRITKQKSKIRRCKIKRLGRKPKLSKMSDDEFMEKMLQIDVFINNDDTEGKAVDDDNIADGITEDSTDCFSDRINEMQTS